MVWPSGLPSLTPGRWAAIVSIVSEDPLSPDGYRELFPEDLGLTHVSVEAHACRHEA